MENYRNRNYIDLLNHLQTIEYLNCGGCLVSAYAVYFICKKYKLKIPQIVILYHYKEDNAYAQNVKFIFTGKGKATSAPHFGWTFDGGETVQDSEEVYGKGNKEFRCRTVIPQEKTKEFCSSALKNGIWNGKFNVKHIKEINRKFRIRIPKIEKQNKWV